MQCQPIAYIRSPYRQKFAVPRQPNLVPEAEGELHFAADYADINALRGLEAFSHLWLIFVFHETADKGYSPTVSPPRLGGTKRLGVFATRSTFRPNPLGLSVVEFIGFEQHGAKLILRIRGLDLIDGTPILDIKPYLPYADCLPQATGGFAPEAPGRPVRIEYSEQAHAALLHARSLYPALQSVLEGVLQQDPRPAQHVRKASKRDYGMSLYDFNIRWRLEDGVCSVISIDEVEIQN